MRSTFLRVLAAMLFALLIGAPNWAHAAPVTQAAAPLSALGVADFARTGASMSEAVRIAVLLTVLSLLPAFVVSMTAFIRIAIVLSMIRHAFGMPETPPTPVLISLALFLTVFAMLPTLQTINHDALQPFIGGHLELSEALERSSGPLRDFMLHQVREDELKWMYEMSHQPLPATPADVSLLQLTPAFILNELRVSFQIGFVILLPFLLIDLVVSSVLLSLGMLMVPPATISLPLKVLMFVLVDGWGLILRGVLGSFK
ncbi:flagellar type III secretion system pore protein FliP [Burkholderia vietnamiensis]|uniref:flagellar type III secretion system pore protein FliP n=1 Tax=Burkholderia vietnamiensis TaxID=60552 RepID=UPI001FC87F42|nr:flagellar type III secretion system pore protein FliP [Burkholderia vietnamiensis]